VTNKLLECPINVLFIHLLWPNKHSEAAERKKTSEKHKYPENVFVDIPLAM